MSEQKRWRPDDWGQTASGIVSGVGKIKGKPFPIVIQEGLEWDILKRKLVEAGADAMLEALEELTVMMLSIYNKHSEGVSVKAEVQGVHGRIIFIPDENVKEVNHVSQGR
jgi:hypothetical protein